MTASPSINDIDAPGPVACYRIGEVARQAGVTTRTLRYYQELGLLDPAGQSPGGNRRYSDADVARLSRIIELRKVMGFDLERIQEILRADDRLAELREEVQKGATLDRRREILAEAIVLNAKMRQQVRDKLAVLEGFLDKLGEKAASYRRLADELGLDQGASPPVSPIC